MWLKCARNLAKHFFPAPDMAVPSPPAPRIIFLDVDGVLRGERRCNFESPHFSASDPRLFFVDGRVSAELPPLDKACLALLVDLVASTGAKVVVSSSWRLSPSLHGALLRGLAQAGLPEGAVIGATPQRGGRGAEVAAWLEAHAQGLGVRSYVVLDDENEASFAQARIAPRFFVKTDAQEGLSPENAEAAKAILLRGGAATA